jgi:phospholipid/cholesterol/gamma-HCH transport system substrate-binding protein
MRRTRQRGPSTFVIGVVGLVVVAVIVYFGFTKSNPFADPYEVKAAFLTSNDLKTKSPVRIAGINVGKVTSVEPLEVDGRPASLVTMELDDRALPLHDDATFKVRPRIFLEGNYFVDVKPGSPSRPRLDDGATVPVQQTSAPVQLSQVLGAFQSDTRQDFRTVLRELGRGLRGGGPGFNRSIPYWEPAFRDSAVVADATRGLLQHDLSSYLRGAQRVAAGLDRDPARLKSLITDFATTAGAFQQEQLNLAAAIDELPDTLGQGHRTLGLLNDAFPSVRRFAREATPAAISSKPTLEAQLPLVRELRGLFSEPELRGLARDLKPVVPDLVSVNKDGVGLQEQQRLTSSCGIEVVQPWQESTIPDPNFASPGPIYQEASRGFVGLAGESRSYDANGQYVRTLAKNASFAYILGNGRFQLTDLPIQGVNPPKSASPPYRPDVPCETQQPPDLRTSVQAPPPGFRIDQNAPGAAAERARAARIAMDWMRDQMKAVGWDKELTLSDEPLTAGEIPRVVREDGP